MQPGASVWAGAFIYAPAYVHLICLVLCTQQIQEATLIRAWNARYHAEKFACFGGQHRFVLMAAGTGTLLCFSITDGVSVETVHLASTTRLSKHPAVLYSTPPALNMSAAALGWIHCADTEAYSTMLLQILTRAPLTRCAVLACRGTWLHSRPQLQLSYLGSSDWRCQQQRSSTSPAGETGMAQYLMSAVYASPSQHCALPGELLPVRVL
jgi:hypothetical protein